MYAILWESKKAEEEEWLPNKIICQTRDEMMLRSQQVWNFNPTKIDIRNFEVVELNEQP